MEYFLGGMVKFWFDPELSILLIQVWRTDEISLVVRWYIDDEWQVIWGYGGT